MILLRAAVQEQRILEAEIRLQERLGYQFRNPDWLKLGLTHRSVHGRTNNERLEFLGDALLGMIISQYLFRTFPDADEGELTRLRASIVKESTLAEVARRLNVGAVLLLGQGEIRVGGFRRDSILADALEALIAAIYYDQSDLVTVSERVLDWFSPQLQQLSLQGILKDSKSQLQEWLQARRMPLPQYSVVRATGPSHAQVFQVSCWVECMNEAVMGEGNSRRQAEQVAAALVLAKLQEASRGQVHEQ